MRVFLFYAPITRTMNPFAVFLVARYKSGYAATTRAADRGEEGRIGLPGGKLDPDETAEQAVIRESAEEGWMISKGATLHLIHEQLVDGKLVQWFELKGSVRIARTYKEQGRIRPVMANLSDLIKSGYGNDVALKGLS